MTVTLWVLYIVAVTCLLVALWKRRKHLISAQLKLEAMRALHDQHQSRDP